MMQELNQSFVFGVSVGEYNFIGRDEEMHRLKMNFKEGINTILISPRRWGKTSLIKKVCRDINKNDVLPVYIDIFRCKSEYELYNLFAKELLKQTSSQTELWMENARDFLSRLTPKIHISSEPYSEYSFSLGITPQTHTPEEVLELAETIAIRKGKRIVVCIDEFQQIGELADSLTIQKRLRTVWQHQKHVSYCLFGSKKHMMINIFQQRNMPLYQFGDMIFLERIPTWEWTKYIVSHFQERKRYISAEFAVRICDVVENHSSYVQQLSWLIFSLLNEGDTVTEVHFRKGLEGLLNSQEQLFLQQIESLTSYQMNFLRCIISGVSDGFGEESIRQEYNLGSPSNITRLKKSLTDKELVEQVGSKFYITDPVFMQWFKTRGYC